MDLSSTSEISGITKNTSELMTGGMLSKFKKKKSESKQSLISKGGGSKESLQSIKEAVEEAGEDESESSEDDFDVEMYKELKEVRVGGDGEWLRFSQLSRGFWEKGFFFMFSFRLIEMGVSGYELLRLLSELIGSITGFGIFFRHSPSVQSSIAI